MHGCKVQRWLGRNGRCMHISWKILMLVMLRVSSQDNNYHIEMKTVSITQTSLIVTGVDLAWPGCRVISMIMSRWHRVAGGWHVHSYPDLSLRPVTWPGPVPVQHYTWCVLPDLVSPHSRLVCGQYPGGQWSSQSSQDTGQSHTTVTIMSSMSSSVLLILVTRSVTVSAVAWTDLIPGLQPYKVITQKLSVHNHRDAFFVIHSAIMALFGSFYPNFTFYFYNQGSSFCIYQP